MNQISLPTLVCKRCQHEWYPRRPEVPVRCAKCKSPYWNEENSVSIKPENEERFDKLFE